MSPDPPPWEHGGMEHRKQTGKHVQEILLKDEWNGSLLAG